MKISKLDKILAGFGLAVLATGAAYGIYCYIKDSKKRLCNDIVNDDDDDDDDDEWEDDIYDIDLDDEEDYDRYIHLSPKVEVKNQSSESESETSSSQPKKLHKDNKPNFEQEEPEVNSDSIEEPEI